MHNKSIGRALEVLYTSNLFSLLKFNVIDLMISALRSGPWISILILYDASIYILLLKTWYDYGWLQLKSSILNCFLNLDLKGK